MRIVYMLIIRRIKIQTILKKNNVNNSHEELQY